MSWLTSRINVLSNFHNLYSCFQSVSLIRPPSSRAHLDTRVLMLPAVIGATGHPYTHALTHSLTHSPTHSLTHPRTHSHTHPLSQPPANYLARSLTHAARRLLSHGQEHPLPPSLPFPQPPTTSSLARSRCSLRGVTGPRAPPSLPLPHSLNHQPLPRSLAHAARCVLLQGQEQESVQGTTVGRTRSLHKQTNK
jgi:hypothetical protein